MRTLVAVMCVVGLASGPGIVSHVPSDYQGKPYEDSVYKSGAQVIPGRVQCAYIDSGGEGVAYHDEDAINHGSGELNRNPRHQRPHASAYVWQFGEKEGVDQAQIGTITFADPGLHLLTFHYNQGNNFAYFEFEHLKQE